MKPSDIQQLLRFFYRRTGRDSVQLTETHISWVILTPQLVFKIKKPLSYSFLDFSTLDKRKYYCESELTLNRRLTQDMYLSVEPVRRSSDSVMIGEQGEIIDYAVKMKRMDETRQMNLLLERKEVTKQHIEQIAKILAAFHTRVAITEPAPEIEAMKEDFNDLENVIPNLEEILGPQSGETVRSAIAFSDRFLNEHAKRIRERHEKGFTIDGHGDLHSKNIFLSERPVIFDCIEFSDHLRKGDVLNEIAFFCMDLDFYHAGDLNSHFLKVYNSMHPCLVTPSDHDLLLYFKCYRANVRVKVNALKATDPDNEPEVQKRKDMVQDYFGLMKRYLLSLSSDQ